MKLQPKHVNKESLLKRLVALVSRGNVSLQGGLFSTRETILSRKAKIADHNFLS